MKTYFLWLLVFGMNALAFAQTPDSTKGKWKISDVTLQYGSFDQSIHSLTRSDAQEITPNSSILAHMDPSITGDYGPGLKSFSSAALGINMGIKPVNSSGTLRIGFLYQGTAINGSFFNRTERSGTFDTLSSVATGETFLVDSTQEETYIVDVRSDYIGADISMIFSTHNKRFNLFSGLGINAMCSLNSKTFVSHTRITSYDQDYTDPSIHQNDVFEGEVYKNKTAFKGAFYIPLGIDFVLGKKRPLFCQTSLHAEFRPALQFAQLPNGMISTSVTRSTLIGFKYTL